MTKQTSDDNTDIGPAIRQMREELGLTQKEMGKELGVSTQTISRWERNESTPRGQAQRRAIAEFTARNAESVDDQTAKSVVKTLGFVGVAAVVGGTLGAVGMAKSFFSPRQKARSTTAHKMLHAAADDLGVDWEEFVEAIAPALEAAESANWTVQDMLNVIYSDQNE